MNNITEAKRRYVIKVDPSIKQGPPGKDGKDGKDSDLLLPVSTDDVDYRGTDLTTIIDNILYVPLAITSFTANQTIYEKGQVLTSIILSWNYNKAVQLQSIVGTNVVTPTLLLTDRSKTVTLNNINVDTVITLTGDDNTGDTNGVKTSQLTLQFLNKIYWGKAAIGTLNSAFILALSNNELKASRQKSFNITTGSNEYIWFASPVAYGGPNFKANGFDGGFTLAGTISFTNASGYTESYYVYRSVNENLGVTSVDVL